MTEFKSLWPPLIQEEQLSVSGDRNTGSLPLESLPRNN